MSKPPPIDADIDTIVVTMMQPDAVVLLVRPIDVTLEFTLSAVKRLRDKLNAAIHALESAAPAAAPPPEERH